MENKLCLGTVQLGLDYGINKKKKPSKEESIKILECAYNNGIKIFDTAQAYGTAEEIIGEFIEKNKLKDKVKIISKLKPNIFEETNTDPKKVIKEEIEKSLKKLKIDKLYGYLFHTSDYIFNKEIVDALFYCKNEGLVENVGVSTYENNQAIYAAKIPIDFIQIPYNILDQRLNKTNFWEIAKRNNVTIFARSPFLQGLLLVNKDIIPEKLSWKEGFIKELPEVKKHIEKIEQITKKYKLNKTESSLLFSQNNDNIKYVVFGVHEINQLKENIEICKKSYEQKAIKDCIGELQENFSEIKKNIILPSLWKKK